MPNKLALLLTASAASIATAAAIALPAIGDDGKDPDANSVKPAGDTVRVEHGPGPAELRACLKDKGLDPPGGDVDLKRWMLAQIDAGKGDVIKGCAITVDGKTPVEDKNGPQQKEGGDERPGPSFSDLKKCLEDKGLNPPAEARALKEWLGPQMNAGGPVDDAAKQCFDTLPPKAPAEYGPSEKERFGTRDYR